MGTARAKLHPLVREGIRSGLSTYKKLLGDRELVGAISQVAQELAQALRGGHRVFLFGNGGSAADAQHLAAELAGRYRRDRPGLPAMALTVNTSSLTAISNDYSFRAIFARQLEALGAPGDVAVGISTSGNSPNVLAGIAAGKRKGIITVGLTGRTGGKLRALADHCIAVPSRDTPRIQEAHILIGHILCEIAERELFGEGHDG